MASTEYVILSKDDSGFWTEHDGKVTAANPTAAVRWHVGNHNVAGTYVAIAARSFKPVTVAVETVTKLKVS